MLADVESEKGAGRESVLAVNLGQTKLLGERDTTTFSRPGRIHDYRGPCSRSAVAVDCLTGYERPDLASLYHERVEDHRLMPVTDYVHASLCSRTGRSLARRKKRSRCNETGRVEWQITIGCLPARGRARAAETRWQARTPPNRHAWQLIRFMSHLKRGHAVRQLASVRKVSEKGCALPGGDGSAPSPATSNSGTRSSYQLAPRPPCPRRSSQPQVSQLVDDDRHSVPRLQPLQLRHSEFDRMPDKNGSGLPGNEGDRQ